MDCNNMNQKQCNCCGRCSQVQPAMDCSCGEPPTTIPVRPMVEPRMERRPEPSCCSEGEMMRPNRPMPGRERSEVMGGRAMMPNRPMPQPDCCGVRPSCSVPKPDCSAVPVVRPMQDCRNCPDTGVGGMEMYPVAMGYIPWQQWQPTYALDRGLARGTIFPDLDLPFVMGRCR